MAIAKHKKTGQIISVPSHYIGHPVLGKNLVSVDSEVQAAPKKENKPEETKEQFAPKAWAKKPELKNQIEENEELEDGN
jgi:hypothetical protein